MRPEALAELHALSFTDTPRPWTAAEFRELLALPTTLLVTLPGGFALGRVAGVERGQVELGAVVGPVGLDAPFEAVAPASAGTHDRADPLVGQ